VTAVGKGRNGIYRVQNFGDYTVGGVMTIVAYEFPNVVKVAADLGVKLIVDHEPR
jgi:hypothetical protein